jgi:nucleoside-diphosphate-sugar epimerase
MLNTNENPEGKTIMVTGGAGYVGSILVRRLIQKGYRVVCVDCLRYGGGSLLSVWGDPCFTLEKVDITDFRQVEAIFHRHTFQSIVHLAAIVGDPACRLEPELARKTNLEASLHLLDLATKYHVAKFVFASTCSNYGRMNDTDSFVDERSPLAPVSLYAELKVEFEDWLLNKSPRNGTFQPTVLRFSTVFGMSPRMRFDLTVNEFTKELALGRELKVFGEQFWRPYCHVEDFSRAILAVLGCDDRVSHNVFNVGDTAQNYTKKMIVEEALKQIPNGSVQYVHKDEDPRNYRVNFDKIKNELGFSISKTVPEGIKDILSCIRMGVISNPDDQIYFNIPV